MALKIIFMDLEGTLLRKAYHLDNSKVAPSAWTLLAEALGSEALKEEEETKDRWNAKGYAGYVEWMEDTIRVHQKYGLTRTLFEKVMHSVEIIPGVPEAVQEVHSLGMRSAIITGGFKFLADKLQRQLKVSHSFAGCEYFFYENGQIEHWNLLPADFEGKVDFMKLTMKEHRIDPGEALFVGDGNNDMALAKEVGVSVAFNAQPGLRGVCTYAIDQPHGAEDFRPVLDVLRANGHI